MWRQKQNICNVNIKKWLFRAPKRSHLWRQDSFRLPTPAYQPVTYNWVLHQRRPRYYSHWQGCASGRRITPHRCESLMIITHRAIHQGAYRVTHHLLSVAWCPRYPGFAITHSLQFYNFVFVILLRSSESKYISLSCIINTGIYGHCTAPGVLSVSVS